MRFMLSQNYGEAIAHFVAAASRTANQREQGSADRPAGPGPGPPHEYKTD